MAINQLNIYVTESKYFQAKLPNIVPSSLTFTNRKDVIRFKNNQLQFYQNQFNLAIGCATSGCGINLVDHLNNKIPLIKSLYNFHLYYQTCKILHYLQIPLPGESSFNEMNNNINMRNYEYIREEFNIPNNKNWYIEEPWPYDYNPYTNLLDEVYNNRYPYMFKSDWEEQRQKFNVPYFVSYWADQNKHVIDTLNQKEMPRYLQFIPKNTKTQTNTKMLTNAG